MSQPAGKGSVIKKWNIQDPEAREAFKSLEKVIDHRKRSLVTTERKDLSKSEILKMIEDDQMLQDSNGQIYFRRGNQVFFIDPSVITELT
jgi:hypothetical protein